MEDSARSLVWATDEFSLRNNNCTRQELLSRIAHQAQKAKHAGAQEAAIGAGAAFGCNFRGEVPLEDLLWVLEQQHSIWTEAGIPVADLSLADTMGWATPWQIKKTLGTIREKWPEITRLSLHLHDTRGLGIANAMAGLEMGVSHFDACCGGLGGCPYSGNGQAAGNVCTEDLVFLCREMGIETGINQEAMIECAKLAEEIVGHILPGHLYKALGLPRKGTKLHERYNR
jgi:hydroxymethylglutaryl-CoA lyase